MNIPHLRLENMTYRIYDESVLEKEADFTLSLDIPESGYAVKNPDGTTPQVSMKVEAPTIRTALGALTQLNDSPDEVLSIFGEHLLGAKAFKGLRTQKKKQAVADKLSEIHTPFKVFGFAVTDTDGNQTALTVTAPSALIAWKAFIAMTNPRNLQGLATSLMPTEDEYDGYDDDDYY